MTQLGLQGTSGHPQKSTHSVAYQACISQVEVISSQPPNLLPTSGYRALRVSFGRCVNARPFRKHMFRKLRVPMEQNSTETVCSLLPCGYEQQDLAPCSVHQRDGHPCHDDLRTGSSPQRTNYVMRRCLVAACAPNPSLSTSVNVWVRAGHLKEELEANGDTKQLYNTGTQPDLDQHHREPEACCIFETWA